MDPREYDWQLADLARQDLYPDERGFQPPPAPRPAELRSYEPTLYERIKGGASDVLAGWGANRYNANKMGDIAAMGASLFPPTGVPIAVSEMRHSVEGKDPLGAILAAPGALPGAGPLARQAKIGTAELRAALRKGLGTEARVGELAATDIPPAPIGHNNPPPEMRLTADELPPTMGEIAAPVEKPKTWAQGLPRPEPMKQSTDIPDIRGLSTEDAIAIARKQHHLIKAGERSEGLYVGGPREVETKQDLNQKRKAFDAYIAADTRGGDWYDRYRRAVNEVTGGDPVSNRWMSAQEGQWSAGVDPGSELHFALKENNAAIAGMPVKAARPAQHEAHLAAIAAKDPELYQLGDKTGEYAIRVNPNQLRLPGATGVNDFRHSRTFGYTEPSGEPQRGALGSAGHKFLDYETALAVDRANQSRLGGRSDWTGEQLQAAPWVRQKALDIMSRNPRLTYDEAIIRANRTIGDYFDRQTYFATHEAQPGADTGHMIGSIAAPAGERAAFAQDPRSTWATAPGGRDAIYAGLGIPGTGVNMRVRPTQEMQGMYVRPDGTVEGNPGWVARPLGTFDTGGKGEPFKSVTPADRSLLNAGEAFRAWTDAQNAGGWHKLWFGGPANQSNTLFYPRPGKATLGEMLDVQKGNAQFGLSDVADTGRGITSTRFWPPPEGGKDFERALRKGELSGPGTPVRARLDSDQIEYIDQWREGIGSGAATRKMLEHMNATPEIRQAFNNNPYIPEQALMKLERDKAWADKWGAPREDIQNARKIVGEGPGWIDRLEAALAKGIIPLPVVAAIYAGAMSTVPAPQKGADREGM